MMLMQNSNAMSDSIQILSEEIFNKKDFIDFNGAEAKLVRETMLLSTFKWSSGVVPLTIQVTNILSKTSPFYGAWLNKIAEGASSIVTTAILGKELSNFLVKLACSAKTVTVVYDLHTKYRIMSYSSENIKLKRIK